MNLLGTQLLAVLAVLVVLLPATTYVLWSRIRGPRVARVVARWLMVVASQLVAVLLVAVAINDYALLYPNWSEAARGIGQLTGMSVAAPARTHKHHVVVPPAEKPGAKDGKVSVLGDPGLSKRSKWATQGRVESVTIAGAYSRLRSHAFVYLPPEYFQPAYARTRFPAVEVFTGYPGDDHMLAVRLKDQVVVRHLVTQHLARPMVLVMMRPSVTFPRDTECTDVPGGPQAGTFFGADVPTQISHHYRVTQNGWGTLGDSTGGYCAVKLAMLNPDVFNAAVSLSGYYFALHDHTTGDLWGGSKTVRHLNDLGWRLQHLPAPPVSVLIATSHTEVGPDGFRGAMRFVRRVKAPMTVDLLTVPHGGHNLATWRSELPQGFSWLSRHLPAPGVNS